MILSTLKQNKMVYMILLSEISKKIDDDFQLFS